MTRARRSAGELDSKSLDSLQSHTKWQGCINATRALTAGAAMVWRESRHNKLCMRFQALPVHTTGGSWVVP